MKSIDFPKNMERISQGMMKRIVDAAVIEDLNGVGDVTSNALLNDSRNEIVKAEIIAKEAGVVSGIDVAEYVFREVSSKMEIEIKRLKKDGDKVEVGEGIISLEGSAQAILTGERTALNFLGMMSGISTKVNQLTSLLEGSKTRLLDTRKTLPGLREFQKYAVRVGGGCNHRIGLYDMILIKENHIEAVGGITLAVQKAKEAYPSLPIEVETETMEQVREVLQTSADVIMLDNMDNPTVEKAMGIINGEKYIEVSGNVNEQRLVELGKIGVDFVSMGALTHTIKPLDISLLIR